MFINQEQGELNLKLIYYGPKNSGKTTNLKYIHANTHKSMRSQLVSLKTSQGNTLFFDFMQLQIGKVKDLRPKFKVFSMAGQVCYTTSRRLLLHNTDCIVFVADSSQERMLDNLESWHTMENHLNEMGYDIKKFPIILQLNKRDSSDAMEKSFLIQSLGGNGRKCFEAVALKGDGVLETFKMGLQSALSYSRQVLGG